MTHGPRARPVTWLVMTPTLANHMELQKPTERPLQEAVDELTREYNVRARCFPRWVDEGRVSKTDAQDRLDRLWTGLVALEKQLLRTVDASDVPTGKAS